MRLKIFNPHTEFRSSNRLDPESSLLQSDSKISFIVEFADIQGQKR